MRLLIFCPHYPPFVGGLESHAAEFNKYMSQHKSLEQIIVFTAHLPTSTPLYEQQNAKITIIRFPAFDIIPNYPFPKFWLPLFWRQWLGLYKEDIDIVLSRTRFFFTSVLALILAKTRRKPWVHIEHGSDYVQLSHPFFSRLAYYYDQTLGRLIFRSSNQNIAISRAVQTFIARFDKRPAPVIYRGVETEFIESMPSDKPLRQRFKNKVIVIFVGRLIDGKGVADLIRTIARLNNQRVIGVIIGSGPQQTKLHELVCSLGLEKHIYFYGQQPLPQALAMVKAADIFVNPSYTEGLPSSVIEAALCSRCIIATDVGGTAEIITHRKSGLLFSPRDTNQLSAYIQQCVIQPELRLALGNQAYKQAKKRFSWLKSCDTYRDILLTLLQQPGKTP